VNLQICVFLNSRTEYCLRPAELRCDRHADHAPPVVDALPGSRQIGARWDRTFMAHIPRACGSAAGRPTTLNELWRGPAPRILDALEAAFRSRAPVPLCPRRAHLEGLALSHRTKTRCSVSYFLSAEGLQRLMGNPSRKAPDRLSDQSIVFARSAGRHMINLPSARI